MRIVKNHPAKSDCFVSYLRGLVGFDFRGWTAKGCRCAQSPLLTEIRRIPGYNAKGSQCGSMLVECSIHYIH